MTEPIRPEDMRASDADRSLVQDRLRHAHDVGQLDLHEFDERVRTAWGARTRGELSRVLADLPIPVPPPPTPKHGVVFSRTGGGVAMQVLTVIWASIVVTNLVIWGIISFTIGEVYPWWLWVAGPPGAVLAVLYIAGIGRPPRRS